ncbi:MAG: hypothetical protein NTY36_02235 [Deltaproteobacteria bacterium]|nr:hypothetical protein [Deltaproteobacteria bacterium]
MSDLKEKRIDEVAAQYPSIPRNLFSPAVDAAGLVNSDYLAGIVTAYQAGAEGRVVAQDAHNAAQLQNLTTAYAEAKGRNDGVMMVALVRQIHALGGAG